MKGLSRVVLYGALAVIVFDAIAAIASLQLGFEYSAAIPGSYMIYATTGFFAWKTSGWKGAALTGLLLGLVDATIGWGISWLIGPGKPPADVTFTPVMWPFVAIVVCATAAFWSLIGAIVARISIRKPQSA
jgi:hypothetical protein